MPDDSEDETYLLETMASHAALVFRPELPKKTVRCDCAAKVGALTAACNDMTEEFRRSREIRGGAALAFAAGAATGVAAMFLKRKR